MTARPSEILYGAATGLEKALVDVDGARITEIAAERVSDMWDAWSISAENLPTLAWAVQCRLWDDDWAEHTKREWTDRQWEFQALRGTRAGLEMALETMGRDFTGGYRLQQILTAPQGFYAAPSLPKETYDSWIRQMPELRIQLVAGRGQSDGGWFVGTGYADATFVGPDHGPALYGRRVVLRREGQPDRDLGNASAVEGAEEICIPGDAGPAFVAGLSYVGGDSYVGASITEPQVFRWRLDASYDHATSALHLSTLAPGAQAIDMQFERVSDIGTARGSVFAGYHAGLGFVDDGRAAGEMLADRIYLFDPRVATPLTGGVSVAGISRVGYPPYHAEMMIDLNTHERRPAWFAGISSEADSFAVPADLRDAKRAMAAVVAAKKLSDRAMLDFVTVHPIKFGDPVAADATFGAHRPSRL